MLAFGLYIENNENNRLFFKLAFIFIIDMEIFVYKTNSIVILQEVSVISNNC